MEVAPEPDRLVVLDFERGVRHLSASFGLDPIAGAAYVDGDLVVVSNVAAKKSHTTIVRVQRFATDVSSASTITSAMLGPVGVVEETTEWFGPKTIAIGSSSIYVSVEWSDYSAEAFGWQAAIVSFDGEARQGPEPSDSAARGPEFSVGLPHVLGAMRGDQLWAGGG